MKAILVIDMPTNCNECTLLNYEYGCPIIGATGDRSKGRSVVCPLKPMPERKEVHYTDPLFGEVENLTNIGYNKCLDDLGETE